MKLLLMCLLQATFLSYSAQAQDRTVTGKVISSDDRSGLPGVSIRIKGEAVSTVSDASGNYRIGSVTDASVLVFNYVGYEGLEVLVGGRTVVDVELNVGQKQLDDVVVIGYGTQRKSDLTGSVSQVKGKELNAYPSTSVLQALAGRASGVQVLQNTGAPGANVSLRIRGTTSIQGSNEPLYVVDGFPLSGGANPSVINNSDVESIEILKDASATAIYGSRGANGVVIITTKRGKAGRTNVNFESAYSSQSLRKKLDLMNAREYAMFYNEQAKNDNVAPYFTQEKIDALGESFDWQDFTFRRAPMVNTSVNVNGGSEKTQFSVSGSVYGQEGILRASDYNRYSLVSSLNTDISKVFSLNLTSTLSRVKSNRQNNGGGNRGGSLIAGTISAPPTLTPLNEDGSYRVLATSYPFISNALINPINHINERTDILAAERVLTNAAVLIKPVSGMTIKLSGGIEHNEDRIDQYMTLNYINQQGNATVSNNRFNSLLTENTVSYNKVFGGKHSIAAVGGFTYQDFINTYNQVSGSGFMSDVTQTYDIGSATTIGVPITSYTKSSIMSILGRVNYTLNDKYLATVSFRADGSSKYSPGNKWGYFPSAALAWRVSKEPFLKDVRAISDLKIRAGWGYTGSQAINAYATLNQLSVGKTVFGDALYNAYAPGTRLPGNLKWETTEQKDIGIDLSLFNNRFVLTADYYVKNTRDLLNTVQLPASLGFTSTIRNVGEIRNRGLELNLDAAVFKGTFNWNLTPNISFNRNRVIKLYNNQDILGGMVTAAIINDNANILREGRPFGQFFGYVEDGYDSNGKIKFKDLTGDGAITAADKTYIGDPNPDFIYGLNSTMSFRNFEFTFFLQGSQGNDLFNSSAINNTVDYGFGLNMPREVFLDHWTPTNTDAKYPVISRTTTPMVSDRFVEDGSYMRLRNIQLGYNIPAAKLGAKWVRSAQIYISGQNLLTFTKYSWWDPDVNSNGGENSTAQGFDYYTYPVAKSITFGIRAGF